MDLKGSLVKGGVLIVHQSHDGKHRYEVENVVKYKKKSEKKMFVRKGDKLVEINSISVEDLKPEELAQKLSEGSPVLTVYNTCKKTKNAEQLDLEEDTIHPVSKEFTVLSFCWEMMREEEENEAGQEVEERETNASVEDNVCEETEVNAEEKDLLVIQMTNTSISLLRGRGCDTENPCEGCHGNQCAVNDIVVVAESSTVTLVPRGNVSFMQEKLSEALIKHELSHRYLRGICSQKTLCSSPNPERITIYYYKSNSMERPFRGMPVVLNFTDSNCFIRCCKEGDKVFLQVEACEKQRLKQISQSDKNALAFVFYMRANRTKQRKFESALHQGWFMCMVNPDSVKMEMPDREMEDPSFLFIIQK